MKILVISHEYPPIGGGGANACRYLCREYARLGHEVTVVTAAYSDLQREEITGGVKIIRVPALREKVDTSSFIEMLTYLISAFKCTDRMCKDDYFDVCQVFFGIPSGPIALHLKKKYHIPYVVRFGGGDIPGAQKRFTIIYKVLTPIINSIWANAKMLVANSEVLREKAQVFNDKNEIRIISNGVDTEFYRREKQISDYSNINMLFVSRLIKGKGLQYVIPRMAEINERTGKTVRLTIVGEGPYRKELESLIDDSNRKLVVFKGRKEGHELLDCYEKANLFMFPSLSEGMPNVVLEAMSMGLPIAMTDCGGSKELIDGNGFSVSIDCFVDKLVSLCKDDERLYEYGIVSRKRIENSFSWDSKAKEYVELFYE